MLDLDLVACALSLNLLTPGQRNQEPTNAALLLMVRVHIYSMRCACCLQLLVLFSCNCSAYHIRSIYELLVKLFSFHGEQFTHGNKLQRMCLLTTAVVLCSHRLSSNHSLCILCVFYANCGNSWFGAQL